MKKKYPFLQLVTTVPKQYKILKPFKNFEPNIAKSYLETEMAPLNLPCVSVSIIPAFSIFNTCG